MIGPIWNRISVIVNTCRFDAIAAIIHLMPSQFQLVFLRYPYLLLWFAAENNVIYIKVVHCDTCKYHRLYSNVICIHVHVKYTASSTCFMEWVSNAKLCIQRIHSKKSNLIHVVVCIDKKDIGGNI